MRTQLFGFQIHLTLGVLLAVGFIAWVVLDTTGSWPFGFAAGVLFVFGVLIHELGHAIMFRRLGYDVTLISLTAMGGSTMTRGISKRPRDAILVGLAGPLVGLLPAFIYLALAFFVPLPTPIASALLILGLLLGLINVVNLLPLCNLDGSNVVHGIVWAIRKDYRKASNFVASLTTLLAGLGIAALFVLLGMGYISFFASFFLSMLLVMHYVLGKAERMRGEIVERWFNEAKEGETYGEFATRVLPEILEKYQKPKNQKPDDSDQE